MECLVIQIYSHFSKVFTYVAWNGDMLLGEIVEDDIMNVLDKEQVIDFYHRDKHRFKVHKDILFKYVKKLQVND
tara:strand:+ start:6990 stop:7211 length:222 start_codon:yes stop_codon:yes gene_type:complete